MKSTGEFRTAPGVLRLLCVTVLTAFAARAIAADAALPCPPKLRTAVNFWIRVYTQIDTDAGFLHDPKNLGVVYETVHFRPGSSLWERRRVVNRERDRIAAQLRRIAAGVRPLTPQERRILALWGPHVRAARLREAADDIRFQLGQSNRFKAGLIRSGAWQRAIARALAAHGVPPELAALPLVESSYNPRAYSKDGAAGLWQFMPGTARPLLRINAALDQRFDPFSATVAAARLLSYNYRILGSWPLAITAYNQGVAGVLDAVHSLGTRDIATIVERYHSVTFGFASRNFYVAFLAALYIERHAQRFFGHLHRLPEEHFRELTLPAYVSMAALERVLDVPLARLHELNPALRRSVWDGELDVPKGYRLRLPQGGPAWTVARLTARLGPRALLAAQLRPPVYRVRPGDTLSGIAARYHVSLWALARFNDISVNGVLRAGEPLHLPGATAPPTELASARAVPGANGEVYRVRPGNTLSGIAARYGVSPGTLARLNHIPVNGLLRIGEPLHLPGAEPGAQGSAPPAIYRVRPGNTLSGIAARYGISPSALARLNHVPVNGLLRIGEPLHLPGARPSTPPAASHAASPNDALAAAQAHAAAEPQPVTAGEAAAHGPMPGPDGQSADSVDPADYSVAPDGTIRVAAAESLGYYAEWLGVSAMDLRRINHLAMRQPVRIGERIRLDFRHVSAQQFQQRRLAYHRALEASYFASHRVDGTRTYVTHGGDSLWTLTQRFDGLPAWLLRQYNPNTDFLTLHPGTQLVIPRIVPMRAG